MKNINHYFWKLAITILSLLVIVIIGFISLHKKAGEPTAQNDTEKCLRDSDCRARLEAAVNEVYSEIGYNDNQ